MYADMEKPVATLSESRPQGGSWKKRKERPTNQGPNIGCQEFSYLDATLGKLRTFSGKFFCRRHRIDTRCMTRHVKSELSASRIGNQMLRRNLNVLRTEKNYFATISFNYSLRLILTDVPDLSF